MKFPKVIPLKDPTTGKMTSAAVFIVDGVITGWKNLTWEGKDVPWSPQHLVALLSSPGIRVQVAKYLDQEY